MRAALLGGGGFRVPLLYGALAASGIELDGVVLHDIDPERLAVVAAVLGSDGPPVTTTGDLDEALDGADLVFAAIRAGGVDARVADEQEAIDAGVIGQETVGAGGLASILRVVPEADAIASRIALRAPGAWTISMTNPAGVVTEAMACRLGERVIGVCDSPVGLIRRVSVALGLDPGPSLAAVSGAGEVDYLGINHLGWLRSFAVDGVDRLPELLADPARLEGFEEGALFGADLVRALGAVPNEYLYWYYARREAMLGITSAARTRAEHVRQRQQEFYAAATAAPADAAALWRRANDERNRSYLAELRDGERDETDVATGGYESVAEALADALTGGPPARLVLNVANGSTVAALDPDAVVETVCDVDASGPTARPVAPLTDHQLGLVAAVRASERAAMTAARTGSADDALRAFAIHPLIDSIDVARRLSARAMERAKSLSVTSLRV